MEKSAIIQPNCAVYEFIDSNQSWMEELKDVYHHFILEDAFLVSEDGVNLGINKGKEIVGNISKGFEGFGKKFGIIFGG